MATRQKKMPYGHNRQPSALVIAAVCGLDMRYEEDCSALDELVERWLQPRDFIEPFDKLWKAAVALRRRGDGITPAMLSDELYKGGEYSQQLHGVIQEALLESGKRITDPSEHIHELFSYVDALLQNAFARQHQEVYSCALTGGPDGQPMPPEEVDRLNEEIRERERAWRERNNGDWRERCVSFVDLDAEDFPPQEWIIPELVSPGLNYLSGRRKRGKSTLLSQWAEAAGRGAGAFPDRWPKPGKPVRVLYISLEEDQPEMQSRLRLQRDGRGWEDAPQNCTLITDWPQWNQGGRERLEDALQEGYQLVMLDGWSSFKPTRTSGDRRSDYDFESAWCRELHQELTRHQAAMIAVRHTIKHGSGNDTLDAAHDNAEGSMGSYAQATGDLLLEEVGSTYRLSRQGRRNNDAVWTLRRDPGALLWHIEGDGHDRPILPPDQGKLLLAVPFGLENKMTPAQLAPMIGKSLTATRNLLYHMMHNGVPGLRAAGSTRDRGYYREQPTCNVDASLENMSNKSNKKALAQENSGANLLDDSLAHPHLIGLTNGDQTNGDDLLDKQKEQSNKSSNKFIPEIVRSQDLLLDSLDSFSTKYSLEWSYPKRVAWYKANGFDHLEAVQAVNSENAAQLMSQSG